MDLVGFNGISWDLVGCFIGFDGERYTAVATWFIAGKMEAIIDTLPNRRV